MKRFKRTCRWLGWASLVISLVVVSFLFRLSLGPMSISWLAPLADGPVEASFPNAHVEYSSPSLAWDPDADSIDLVLENVRLNDSSTGLAAEFPKISIAFSEEAMIQALQFLINEKIILVK